MPEPITPEQLEDATRMAAAVVETFGDDWDLHYDAGMEEVSCRAKGLDTFFEGSYVEIFNTSQCSENSDESPVAEFLAASIVVVPRLIGEIERLKVERDNARKAAKDMGRVIDVVAMEIRRAVRLANAGDPAAAMSVITEWASEADWLDNLDADDEGGEPRD